MTEKELNELLLKAQTHGGNHFAAQIANANQGLKALNDIEGLDKDSDMYRKALGSLNASKGSAIAGSAMSILGGATDMLNNAFNMSQIADTSKQQGMINDMDRIGSGSYGSFSQLGSAYDSLNAIQPDLGFDTIRGGSTGQRIGNVFSSTLSGAATGLTVGGPWGALAGAVVGLGSGVGGWLAGDAKARNEQRVLASQASQAQDAATSNLDAAGERLRDRQFRAGVVNSSSLGGKVERPTVKDFAKRALRRPRQRDFVQSGRVVRQRCDGGTMIRIKR